MNHPIDVKLVEVGPRDGLQNEKNILDTQVKIDFINQLSQTGLKHIEVTSFVSPKWVPQLADQAAVYTHIQKNKSIIYSALVPNEKGMENALACQVQEVAVFTTPSETFSKKNTNQSVEDSLQQIAQIIHLAKKNNILVRGYLSCVLGCPYEGEVPPENVLKIAKKLIQMGCYEISLGDTIGIGTATQVKKLINLLAKEIPLKKIAVHFHDTYGQALVNCYVALEQGVRVFDSSIAGLGGCPYAKGATGNVATEDLIYLFEGINVRTGVHLDKVIQVGQTICKALKTINRSKVALTYDGAKASI